MKRPLISAAALIAAFIFPGCILAGAAVAPTALKASTAPQLYFSVKAQFPHDRSAFTEGLFWNSGNLYESTGLVGHSSLRKVDLISGKVLLQRRLPDDVFGEGIAEMKGKLVQLTWQKQHAYIYDFPGLTVSGSFPYRGEGWGLTTDGKSWISSNGSDTLTWRDANTFQPLRSMQVTWNGVPVKNLNELEWIEGKVWANVWYTNRILQIDPQSGNVLSYIDITNLIPTGADAEDVPNGIAYDSAKKRIFITGKRWPWIYEIQLK